MSIHRALSATVSHFQKAFSGRRIAMGSMEAAVVVVVGRARTADLGAIRRLYGFGGYSADVPVVGRRFSSDETRDKTEKTETGGAGGDKEEVTGGKKGEPIIKSGVRLEEDENPTLTQQKSQRLISLMKSRMSTYNFWTREGQMILAVTLFGVTVYFSDTALMKDIIGAVKESHNLLEGMPQALAQKTSLVTDKAMDAVLKELKDVVSNELKDVVSNELMDVKAELKDYRETSSVAFDTQSKKIDDLSEQVKKLTDLLLQKEREKKGWFSWLSWGKRG